MAQQIEQDLEAIIRATAQFYANTGRPLEVALLAHSQATLEETNYDNWDGGQYYYDFVLGVPSALYFQIAPRLPEIEADLREKIEFSVRRYSNQHVSGVRITTELDPDPNWREKAKAWLEGKGVTNQGRVRSDNVASRICDGLLFRSSPEIYLYRALKALGVSFAPLPVFLRGGADYRRIEPDFIIIRDGLVLQVEVDGDTVHTETPAEAHARVKILLEEGVLIERIESSTCDSETKAVACAKKLLALLEKHKNNRR